jgi:hypothetical protein
MYALIALTSDSELVDFSTPFPFPDTALVVSRGNGLSDQTKTRRNYGNTITASGILARKEIFCGM